MMIMILICDCNNEKTDLQRLCMNIGADGWSKDKGSLRGFHTRVFRYKKPIAL